MEILKQFKLETRGAGDNCCNGCMIYLKILVCGPTTT